MSYDSKNPKLGPYLTDDGGTYRRLSLAKLLGQDIVDIEGHITNEWGEPYFQMVYIVTADGTRLDAEGEHDMPYLVGPEEFHELLRKLDRVI